MIFKCQSCGRLYPIIQAETSYLKDIESLYCRKCYAKRVEIDSLVNVMAFIDIAA